MPAKNSRGNTTGRNKPMQSYLFKDKDPVIDELRTMVEDTYGERINRKNLKDIEENGGATQSAMLGWFMKGTRRPSNANIEATARTLGWERRWHRRKAKVNKAAPSKRKMH